ncbi:SH3 domain-containing protein [Ekhidna sp.]|uniref:SH3 domain-containing protein n=1 Tax=Ekhidna sp. TaxID=2608089 RepID=UPI0035149A54
MINRIKVRLFLGILFGCFLCSATAQNELLTQGDSLFNQQKYTEAFKNYNQLLSDGKVSTAMLLKMAFIQDGLGNYEHALYFLDLYYQKSADRNVVGKIEELAEANELEGYTYDDINYFFSLLEKYRMHFTLLLTSVMILLLVYVFKKANVGEKPIAAVIIQVFVVAMLFSITNLRSSNHGIITSNGTLLRSGPSAGAEPITLINKGHKVKVLDQTDVWTKILWDGEEVYVRNGKVRVI